MICDMRPLDCVGGLSVAPVDGVIGSSVGGVHTDVRLTLSGVVWCVECVLIDVYDWYARGVFDD